MNFKNIQTGRCYKGSNSDLKSVWPIYYFIKHVGNDGFVAFVFEDNSNSEHSETDFSVNINHKFNRDWFECITWIDDPVIEITKQEFEAAFDNIFLKLKKEFSAYGNEEVF